MDFEGEETVKYRENQNQRETVGNRDTEIYYREQRYMRVVELDMKKENGKNIN